jgi:hypothetical protein
MISKASSYGIQSMKQQLLIGGMEILYSLKLAAFESMKQLLIGCMQNSLFRIKLAATIFGLD